MPPQPTTPRQASSLWQTDAHSFFPDPRASHVGDIITVDITIADSGQISNTTTRTRNNSDAANLTNFFGLENSGLLAGDKGSLVNMGSTTSNVGAGSVNRSEAINLTLAALVTQILPNGNMVIDGHQQVKVNTEMRDLQIAGVVRHEDITQTNTVNLSPDRRSAHLLWRPGPDHRRAAAALRFAAVRYLDAVLGARRRRFARRTIVVRVAPERGRPARIQSRSLQECGRGVRAPAPSFKQRGKSSTPSRLEGSIVPIDLLATLMAFLRFDRQRRDRARVETLQRNRLAGLFAEAVRAVFDPAQRRVDLGDQLSLAVARAQLELALGFGRSPVGQIGMQRRLGLQVLDGLAALAQDVVFPAVQLAAEIFALPLIHEGLTVRRLIAKRKLDTHGHSLDVRPHQAAGVIQALARPFKWNRAQSVDIKPCFLETGLSGPLGVGLLELGELDAGAKIDFVQHALELGVDEAFLLAADGGGEPGQRRAGNGAGQKPVADLVEHIEQVLSVRQCLWIGRRRRRRSPAA